MRVTLIRKTYVKVTFQGLYHTVGNVGKKKNKHYEQLFFKESK